MSLLRNEEGELKTTNAVVILLFLSALSLVFGVLAFGEKPLPEVIRVVVPGEPIVTEKLVRVEVPIVTDSNGDSNTYAINDVKFKCASKEVVCEWDNSIKDSLMKYWEHRRCMEKVSPALECETLN